MYTNESDSAFISTSQRAGWLIGHYFFLLKCCVYMCCRIKLEFVRKLRPLLFDSLPTWDWFKRGVCRGQATHPFRRIYHNEEKQKKHLSPKHGAQQPEGHDILRITSETASCVCCQVICVSRSTLNQVYSGNWCLQNRLFVRIRIHFRETKLPFNQKGV